MPELPVLPAAKIMSGSSTRFSRMQKKDARQLDVDQMSLVAPANGSPNLVRRAMITRSMLWSVSVRATRRIFTHVSR